MLACIPHTMSRKRKAIPFAPSDYDLKGSLRKRTCREVDITSPSSSEEIKSLDLVVMSRSSRTRRLASVKAQIAVTSLLSAEHHRSRSSSPHNCTTEDNEVLGKLPASLSRCTRRPHSLFDEKITQNRFKRKGDSCNSSLSPLSSLGSEWDEEKVVESSWKVSPPKIKSPVLNLMPVVECTKIPAKPRAKKSVDPAKLNGYVRRMASLNARACVTAMMEPVRRPSKQKGLPSKSTPAPTTSPVCNPSECLSSSPRRVSPRRSPVPQQSVVSHSRHNSVEKEIFDGNFSPGGYVVVCGSPMTLKEYGIIRGCEYSETSNFNTEGLLWNGDTLHPQSRVYLAPDGSLPRLIVPPVCPVRPNCVQEVKGFAKIPLPKKTRAVKGDNGWSMVGNPIKEVLFPHEDGTKVARKYYAGMRRKNEELWVRDCITVKSGKRKQDRPYIAKIGSIWKEEKGGLMVTLFWYYRPEDTGIQSTDFQEDEVLGSQHYDDNSVACIEDKCFVLGLRQYCRYRAQCRAMAEGIGNLESFSVVHCDPNELEQLGLDPHSTNHKPASHVFLCYRGYNHIAGRLLKSHK